MSLTTIIHGFMFSNAYTYKEIYKLNDAGMRQLRSQASLIQASRLHSQYCMKAREQPKKKKNGKNWTRSLCEWMRVGHR